MDAHGAIGAIAAPVMERRFEPLRLHLFLRHCFGARRRRRRSTLASGHTVILR